MRLFFVYRGRKTPSGGHKQTRLMVSLLNKIGVDACLLYDGATDDDHFYGFSVPAAPFTFQEAGNHVESDDVVVHTEVRLERFLGITRNWTCRRAINNRNGYYSLRDRPARGYRASGIEFAIANAPYSAALTSKYLGLAKCRIFHVPNWVCRSPFDVIANAPIRRPLAVAFMPRKRPEDISKIQQEARLAQAQIRWVPIDGQPEQIVAQRLRECSIFLSTQDREGCPSPALEAMGCGCLVTGYPGTGAFPHPYATDGNGLWARDRSPSGAAAKVSQAVELAREGGPTLDRFLEAGYKTMRRFSESAATSALRSMVDVLSDQCYEDRSPEVPRLDWHARRHAHAYMTRVYLDVAKHKARGFFSALRPRLPSTSQADG